MVNLGAFFFLCDSIDFQTDSSFVFAQRLSSFLVLQISFHLEF